MSLNVRERERIEEDNEKRKLIFEVEKLRL